MQVVLINRTKEDSQICGVVAHLIDDGLSILQYANDETWMEEARNMKLLLADGICH
jgi:hypothetical protein